MRKLMRTARQRWRRLRHRPKGRGELLDYWRAPDDAGNQPDAYARIGAERSRFLVELVRRHAAPGSTVLELGCNVGRNLKYLHEAGWVDLAAIEINEAAIGEFQRTFPDVAADTKVLHGSLEERLPDLPDDSVDVVFSMAVLEHVHYDSDKVLSHALRVARQLLITIENEEDVSDRTFPRNYQRAFEQLGGQQIEQVDAPPDLPFGFVARVFAPPVSGRRPSG